jgi:hypothetical protein
VLPGALFLPIGAALLWVGHLAQHGRLRRNRLVGVRTRTTMASEEAWIAAHRASAWSMTASGAVLLAAGTFVLVLRPSETVTGMIIGAGALGMLAFVVMGGVQGQRAAKDALR